MFKYNLMISLMLILSLGTMGAYSQSANVGPIRYPLEERVDYLIPKGLDDWEPEGRSFEFLTNTPTTLGGYGLGTTFETLGLMEELLSITQDVATGTLLARDLSNVLSSDVLSATGTTRIRDAIVSPGNPKAWIPYGIGNQDLIVSENTSFQNLSVTNGGTLAGTFLGSPDFNISDLELSSSLVIGTSLMIDTASASFGTSVDFSDAALVMPSYQEFEDLRITGGGTLDFTGSGVLLLPSYEPLSSIGNGTAYVDHSNSELIIRLNNTWETFVPLSRTFDEPGTFTEDISFDNPIRFNADGYDTYIGATEAELNGVRLNGSTSIGGNLFLGDPIDGWGELRIGRSEPSSVAQGSIWYDGIDHILRVGRSSTDGWNEYIPNNYDTVLSGTLGTASDTIELDTKIAEGILFLGGIVVSAEDIIDNTGSTSILELTDLGAPFGFEQGYVINVTKPFGY